MQVSQDRLVAPFPAPILLAAVGQFDNEISAYLWFDFIRGRDGVDSDKVLLNTSEDQGAPTYRIYIVVPNDALTAIPYLSSLEARGIIQGFELVFSNPDDAAYRRDQTSIFVATYKKPVNHKLENLPDKELLPSVARFLRFKSRTDPRSRAGTAEASSLGDEQATEMAADIMSVAKFYDLPLDVFLGIGAMENNYLNIKGDLEHSIWKRRAAKDDIILKRLRHRVLVANYSIGVWQITRETLRYAHNLYLKDTRDYSELPERLHPPQELQFDLTNSHVLTTYAGLLLRDLLDQFNGDVQKAVGAYNGGVRNPNIQYAAGVNMVAQYARNILERVNKAKSLAVVEAPMTSAEPSGLEVDEPEMMQDEGGSPDPN